MVVVVVVVVLRGERICVAGCNQVSVGRWLVSCGKGATTQKIKNKII